MNRRFWLPAVLTFLVSLYMLTLDTGPAEAAVPDGFEDRLVTSVQGPTAMAFTPDGRMLISTQPGILRLRKSGASSTTQALDISRKICSDSERGMLGVAVDPNFSSNHYVYLYYTYKKFGVCPKNDPKNKDNPVNRVSRFVMSGDTVSRSSEKVLIDNIPSPNGNHNGGDVHFGKDGYLYVSVGDGGRDYKNDSGGGGENDASRDRNILLGKILRVTRDGSIPGSNPYTGPNSERCGIPSANGRTSPGDNCKETFARGLRNPFRIGFDPDYSGTRFFINDVGQSAWEEIDVGKKAADYAWNLCEGRHDNPDRPGSVDCNSAPYTPPIYNYSHDTGCSSVTGSAFVPDGVWPASYNKSYLFGDYVCGKIFRLTPKSGGGYSKTAFATGLGQGGPVAMTFSPSGKTLYYTTYAGGDGGQIRGISYIASGNRTPNADIKINGDGENYGPQDKQFQFSGAGSTDPDGDSLAYSWDFGDGTTSTGADVSHTYSTAGKKTVILTIKDGKGGTGRAAVEVFPNDTAPPAPQIEAPSATTQFKVGQTITLRGSATDADDGSLPDNGLNWSVRRYHNGSHYHPYFSETGNDLTFSAPPPEDLLSTNPEGNYLQVRLTATDSQGLSRTVTRKIEPDTVRVAFASRPTDLKLEVNGKSFAAPRTFLSWVGYKLNIYALRQQHDGKTWVFSSWSDGRAARHTITSPADNKKYTAAFQRP